MEWRVLKQAFGNFCLKGGKGRSEKNLCEGDWVEEVKEEWCAALAKECMVSIFIRFRGGMKRICWIW